MDPSPPIEALAFFQGLDPADRRRIVSRFQDGGHQAGEVIFEQGQPADRLFLLTSGRVEIRFKPYDGEALTVCVIGPGGVFGWSAALGRDCYTSGAVCTEDCRHLSIRGRDLRQMCEEHPSTGVILLERMAEVIALRLTSTHSQVMELLRGGIRPPAEAGR